MQILQPHRKIVQWLSDETLANHNCRKRIKRPVSYDASHLSPCQYHGRTAVTCFHAFACKFELVRRHPEGLAVVWVIGDGDVAVQAEG